MNDKLTRFYQETFGATPDLDDTFTKVFVAALYWHAVAKKETK